MRILALIACAAVFAGAACAQETTAKEAPNYFLASLPIASSIIVATGSWIFTYLHGKRAITREAELDRVNDQLRLLYGPLYARLAASDAAWNAFWSRHRPSHGQSSYFHPDYKLTAEEQERWRLWMTEVFHPLNKSLEAIIVSHSDLIEDGVMPSAFVSVLAHIATYDAVIAAWEKGDFSHYTSVLNFPGKELAETVQPTYKKLLDKQQRLIKG